MQVSILCTLASCTLACLVFFVSTDEVIDIDSEHAEHNGPFIMYCFLTDVLEGGKLHDGYDIIVQVDINNVTNDKYKAWLISLHSIIIQILTLSHAALFEMEKYFKAHKVAGHPHCTQSQVAHEVAIINIVDRPSRQTKKILLQFPSDAVLSNKHYSPDTVNVEIDYHSVPVQTLYQPAGSKAASILTCFLHWKVSTVGGEP